MKSKDKTLKINNLVFQWDYRLKNLETKDNKERLLDEYFDFLSEILPHKQELTKVKVFKIPFSL